MRGTKTVIERMEEADRIKETDRQLREIEQLNKALALKLDAFMKLEAKLQLQRDALEKARVALVELIAAAPQEGEGSQRAIACINEVLGPSVDIQP